MAKRKPSKNFLEKAKATQFKKGKPGGPGRPPSPLKPALRRATHRDLAEVANMMIENDVEAIKEFVEQKRGNFFQQLIAKTVYDAYLKGDIYAADVFLNRLVGRPLQDVNAEGMTATQLPGGETPQGKKTFAQFCEAASYPTPFPKQEEMRSFGMDETDPRLLLGSRNYGKTDYITVLGIAYAIYLNPALRFLIVTKSRERNAAMLEEIAKALKANGVILEKENALCIRVSGLIGKDHSVSTITIGAKSVRGRHPDCIVLDDPVTEDDDSEATRRRVKKLYNELHKLCSNILVIGQPVHKSDLYADLRPLLKKLEVPYGSIPELDPDLEAQRLAGVDEASISASYYLKVIAENPTPFENVNFLDDFPKEGSAVAFIDPSFEGGDFTALSIAKSYFEGMAVKGRVWKRSWDNCIDEIVEELVRCNVRKVCFETNSLGSFPLNLLRQKVPDTIGVVGKKSTGFKHSRIMNAGVFADHIWLAKSSDRKYIEQVTHYEDGVKNDDAPDSLASLLEWVGLIRGKKI